MAGGWHEQAGSDFLPGVISNQSLALPAAVRTAPPRADALPRGAARPLSLLVTLARNPLRTLPMFLAILAASFGIATIVLFAHSLVRTGLATNDFLVGTLFVRTNGATVSEISDYVRSRPETSTLYRTRLQFVRGRILDMPVWFPVQLTSSAQVPSLTSDYGNRLVQGRYPEKALEIVVPVAFAANRGVGIGDEMGGPSDFTRLRLTIVGLTEGPHWVILGSADGLPLAQAPESVLLFPKGEDAKRDLEAALTERFGGTVKVRHWALGSIDIPDAASLDETQYRGDLQLVLWFIVTVNSAVLAGIGALLSLIYFRQRRPEFVLLSVLGRSRRTLFTHVVTELVVVAGTAWMIGLAAGYAFSGSLGETLLRSRGISMQLQDADPAVYTLPLVTLIVGVSAIVTLLGFLRFDPVSEMEMRG